MIERANLGRNGWKMCNRDACVCLLKEEEKDL